MGFDNSILPQISEELFYKRKNPAIMQVVAFRKCLMGLVRGRSYYGKI